MTINSSVKRGAISRPLHKQIPSATFQSSLALRNDLFPSGYEPLRLVSKDCFTNLWHARCRRTGTPVMLKCLRDDWWGNTLALRLFQREVEVGRNLSSSHLLRTSQLKETTCTSNEMRLSKYLQSTRMMPPVCDLVLSAGKSRTHFPIENGLDTSLSNVPTNRMSF